MTQNHLIRNILQDVNVDLMQEFDRNFERKAFFDQKWPSTKHQYSRGSLMMRSGKLRRSITARINGTSITFRSNMPYAAIHNEGGEITVTAKMKRYFWAMYYKVAGAVTYNVRSKAMTNTQRNRRLSTEAEQYKAMALMKVGSLIKIEQRQFIGHHPQVNTAIRNIVDHHMQELARDFGNKLKQHGK